MDPETVINLIDTHWFFPKILKKPSEISISSTPEPNYPTQQTNSKQISHTRSKSDEFISSKNSPNSVLITRHLQTINSGKEISPEIPKTHILEKRRKGRLSKSLSELEFEELTGFVDIGFVFSEEDKDDLGLVEILPGLQLLGRRSSDCEGEMDLRPSEISGLRTRPYLSEAWEIEESPLMNWKVPMAGNEIDMKDSLKWWAHTVASVVT